MNIPDIRRKERADLWFAAPRHPRNDNGDEGRYADRRGNFSKGLQHNHEGLVAGVAAYDLFAQSLNMGNVAGIDATALSPAAGRKLVSPKTALARELIGGDPDHYCIPPAPAFASAEEVVEIVENFWMARLRDVSFQAYAGSDLAQKACEDLQAVITAAAADPNFVWKGAPVTTSTLFRGTTDGEELGPYLSQFMLLPTPFGAERIGRRMRTVNASLDYGTAWPTWLAIQNGLSQPMPMYDPLPRYMRNGRDLSEWVHIDQLYQAYFMACLILLGYHKGSGPAFAPNLPYRMDIQGKNQDGFATFGGAHILALVTEVSTRALKAVWRQKWRVNRRLRPEAFAGRIHFDRIVGGSGTRFDIAYDVLDAAAHLKAWAEARDGGTGNWLLPLAFPEGSPLHPAYGAGHATVAGACTTILKAWFDGPTKLVDLTDPFTGAALAPVMADLDGLALETVGVPDAGQLTIEGELNKVAANIGIGRNIAGVHWRTDHTASIALGERVAIHTLWDYATCLAESDIVFRFNAFDGTPVEITPAGVTPSYYEGGDTCVPAPAPVVHLAAE